MKNSDRNEQKNNMTEKELREFLIAHYPIEDEKCDWKEMKNLKNSFNGHEGEDVGRAEEEQDKEPTLFVGKKQCYKTQRKASMDKGVRFRRKV